MQQNATRVMGWILLLIVAMVAMLTYRRSVSDFGIGGIGFVFGYVLYYAVRQTKDFNVGLLATTFSAILGEATLGWTFKNLDAVAAYGAGLALGFVFYLGLACILVLAGGPNPPPTTLFLSKTLLGSPHN
jgi:hypothetical protein